MSLIHVNNYVVHLVADADPSKEVIAFSHGTFFFPLVRHNWTKDLVIETTWKTDVEDSFDNMNEDRMALWERPLRMLRYNLNGSTLDRDDAARTLMQVQQHANETLPAPLTVDKTRATANAAIGDTVVFCDTTYRRFYPGMRVAIVPSRYGRFEVTGIKVDAHAAVITTVVDDRLTFEEGIPIAVTANDWLIPMLDVEPAFKSGGAVITDRQAQYALEVYELPGDSALPSLAGLSIESLFPYHDGKPIFTYRADSVNTPRISIFRGGAKTPGGRNHSFYTRGSRPFFGFQFVVTTVARSDSWKLLEFMDWARGRYRSFWFANPQIRFTATDVSGTTLEVEEHITSYVQSDHIDRVFIYYVDGTYQIADVNSVADNGDGTLDLVLADVVSQVLANIRAVTTAHLVRNTSDAFRQAWLTDAYSSATMSFIEILSESTVTIT